MLHRPSAMPACATISATRAVRSIISRGALVRIRSSVIVLPEGRLADLARAAADREGDPAGLVEPALDLSAVDRAHAAPREHVDGLAVDRRCLAVDVLVRLDIDLAPEPADLDRLVGELAGSADRHLGEEMLDVLRIEPHAPVTHLHADAPGNVGAVDAVRRQRQL